MVIAPSAFRNIDVRQDSPTQSNPPDVDADQEWIWNTLIVTYVRVNAALHWEHEPFKVTIVRCVVQAGRSAENVHGVIVTPKETVWPVAKDLLTTMGLDLIRKGHLQPPPRLAINGDRGKLFGLEAVLNKNNGAFRYVQRASPLK
jgi:hypothetical protein